MALEIPKSRLAVRQIQTTKRNVPLDQIIAIQGQNPVASGVETTGNVIGQAIAKRAALRQQGQQVAQLAAMAGEQAPTDNSLTSDLYEKGLALKNAQEAKTATAAEKRVELGLKLQKLKNGYSEIDPTSGKVTNYPGVQGLSIVDDANGNPSLSIDPNTYKPGSTPKSIGGGGSGGGANQNNKRWDQLVKDTDPYKASSRSALGVATLGNQRANRAIPVLQNPKATNQDINTAIADISGIFQGGVPTEAGIHAQEYNTLLGKFANLQTLVTSNPTAAALPEVKQHLLDLVNTLKDVNNSSIKDQFDYIESAQPDLINQHKDSWSKMRQQAGVGSLQPITPAKPQGIVDPEVMRLINKHK